MARVVEVQRSAERDGGTGSPTWRGRRTECRPWGGPERTVYAAFHAPDPDADEHPTLQFQPYSAQAASASAAPMWR
jgi:hypothetical protein